MEKLRALSNKSKFNSVAIGAWYNSFERSLIWQNEDLEEYADRESTYTAKNKCKLTCDVFMAMVYLSDIATDQALNWQLDKVGHDLALQMLGHGVGFWEQEETNILNDILDFLMTCNAILPFELYYDSDDNKIEEE